MLVIKSKDNKIIKRYNSLNNKKKREELKTFVIEGKRFVYEAIKEKVGIKSIIVSESFFYKNKKFIEENKNDNLYIIEDVLLSKVSNTENPQGIFAEIDYIDSAKIKYLGRNLILILDKIKDPGNMGTIIRTADAFDIKCIYCTKGCVDVYNPKVLRATMGSVFRMPIFKIENESDLIKNLKEEGYKFISTCLDGEVLEPKSLSIKKSVFIIGNESEGVSEYLKNQSDLLFKIPINNNVDSLNASVAAAIVMYNYKMFKENKYGY
jgi:TrmH family RNA methyltransferase